MLLQAPAEFLPFRSVRVPAEFLPFRSVRVPAEFLPFRSVRVPAEFLPFRSVRVPEEFLPFRSVRVPEVVSAKDPKKVAEFLMAQLAWESINQTPMEKAPTELKAVEMVQGNTRGV